MKICSIDDCKRPLKARGMCGMHWARWRTHGDPHKILQSSGASPNYFSLEVYLSNHFIKNEQNKCWEWRKPGVQGYGHAHYRGKNYRAHRLSYIFYKGVIPDGLDVLHECDNRKCVNPDHLWIGTNSDNQKDAVQKGRNRQAKGEQQHFSKLKAKEVIEIKEMLAQQICGAHIAALYGVCKGTIYEIKSGRSWKHINIERMQA